MTTLQQRQRPRQATTVFGLSLNVEHVLNHRQQLGRKRKLTAKSVVDRQSFVIRTNAMTFVWLVILLNGILFSYFICYSTYQHGLETRVLHPSHFQQERSLRKPAIDRHKRKVKSVQTLLKNDDPFKRSDYAHHSDITVDVNNNDTVLVVLISDRLEGIIPTVASILTHTKSKPVDFVLISNNQNVNEQAKRHFTDNKSTTNPKRAAVNQFTSYSIAEIQTDLISQGYHPIWTWPEWGSSRHPNWFRSNYTLHVAEWDILETHAHELNHLRFYLPLVSFFRMHKYLYFVDDDILVQKDLGTIADTTMKTLDNTKGLVTPCNIWIWNNECHLFGFHNEDTIKTIFEMPSLYGDRSICKSESERHCYPPSYPTFLESIVPRNVKINQSDNNNEDIPRNQKAWNFGFSLFALDNWRSMNLTSRYEAVMRDSYRLHVFPETSLTFGLGVSYIAFAGAVECWNDKIMKVRDGFGFIEWNRFVHTFGGPNFINSNVDVIHYTGPTKPWVANTTIEPSSLKPWLDYMNDEGMDIPQQLPEENGKHFFTLLASDRTGSQWIMSLLDSHPAICASGEGQKPESGFPSDVMQPGGTPWLPVCSVKRGCSFAFVLEAMQDLAQSMDKRGRSNRVPTRCQSNYLYESDEWGHHLPRLCNFFSSLDGNYTDGAIAAKWIDAFINENQDLLPCSCPRGTVVKGIKVYQEWLLYQNYPNHPLGPPYMNLNETAINGSKIIRLKRRNLWARYLSSIVAQYSNVYHVNSLNEKEEQVSAAGNITISIGDMLIKLRNMEAIDKAGDDWALRHGSEVLEVSHEDCQHNTTHCFHQMFEFLGVDPSFAKARKTRFKSTFSLEHSASSLNHVVNKGAVQEALAVNGYGKFIGLHNHSLVQLLIYDDSETLDKVHQFHQEKGIEATMFGRKSGQHKQYFSKFAAAIPILKRMHPDTLVVLSDNRGVRIQFPAGSDFLRYEAISDFRDSLYKMTRDFPGAIVASADSYCCSSALTHVKLGGLFHGDGSRKARSCVVGQPGCEWTGDNNALPWQSFMKDLALRRGKADSGNVFLEGSLLGGTAGDMIKFITSANIGESEDDRAVLTDFLYHNPDKIILDYEQILFGKDRDSHRLSTNRGCPFRSQHPSTTTSRKLSNSLPLFMHAPRDLGCIPGRNVTENPIFPRWAESGIRIGPILDHIDRVVNEIATITSSVEIGGKPIYYQGPEVLYIPDERGVWTSKLIRDRTDNLTLVWRTIPTEGLIYKAHQILKSGRGSGTRWNLARKYLKSGGFPYWAWYGDFKTCNFGNYLNDSIPLFTPSVMASCDHAFPVPNYMNIIDSQPTSDNWRGLFRDTKAAIPWKSKIRKVVWRGSLSEADGNLALNSVRWRTNKLVYSLNSTLYDVGLTSIPSWVSNQISINVSEIGGLVHGISPMSEFQRFMAILDMDGNSWSSRFATLLCYNSVVVKIEPKYVEYFYSTLHPWTHYIPVKGDLSDLHENVQWALNPENEEAVQDIIVSANEWCSQRMIPDELAHDLLDIWESYVRNLNRASPDWQKDWLNQKSALLSSTSNLNLFRLRET